jgi:hypothetical protein
VRRWTWLPRARAALGGEAALVWLGGATVPYSNAHPEPAEGMKQPTEMTTLHPASLADRWPAGQRVLHCIVLPPSQKEGRYGICAGQTLSTLTKFVKNTWNIYISK